jgi:hypothetical protein
MVAAALSDVEAREITEPRPIRRRETAIWDPN